MSSWLFKQLVPGGQIYHPALDIYCMYHYGHHLALEVKVNSKRQVNARWYWHCPETLTASGCLALDAEFLSGTVSNCHPLISGKSAKPANVNQKNMRLRVLRRKLTSLWCTDCSRSLHRWLTFGIISVKLNKPISSQRLITWSSLPGYLPASSSLW